MYNNKQINKFINLDPHLYFNYTQMHNNPFIIYEIKF